MADKAHYQTDLKLEEMEKRLSAIYSREEKEIQKTAEEALANLGDCYRAGDTVTFGIHTAGYVTNSGNTVRFIVPLAKPMIGSPTISMSSIDGFILRQNGVYTHGSSATEYVIPSECYAIGVTSGNAVVVSAKFDDTTNVTNNDTIAVVWSGTITFS